MPTLSSRASTFALLLAVAACDEAKPAQPQSRTVAVAASSTHDSADEFCDHRYTSANAPTFKLPEVEGPEHLRQRARSGRRWINLWASWCGPCVEELPLLRTWFADYGGAAPPPPASLVLLSVDSTPDAVARFTAVNPDAHETLRLAKNELLESFLKSVGLDANATLPVHLLVDAENRVTCTRMGAVKASDAATVRALLSR